MLPLEPAYLSKRAKMNTPIAIRHASTVLAGIPDTDIARARRIIVHQY